MAGQKTPKFMKDLNEKRLELAFQPDFSRILSLF
jgi:hypothetical protein